MKKKTLLTVLLIVLLLSFMAYYKYQRNIYSPLEPKNQETTNFEIKKGESAKTISENLENAGLISSSLSFRFHTKAEKLGTEIAAGNFQLSSSMSSAEILEKITTPNETKSLITIQEGLTSKDIDQKLTEMAVIESGEFIAALKSFTNWDFYPFLKPEEQKKLGIPLEGYIYPDTYFIDPSSFTPEQLIFNSLDNFENKTSSLLPQIKKHSIQEIITMASIIEKEVFGEKDRKLVSGILWKRLENNWPLGADATIIYVTDNNKINAADLQIDSPYNTRKFGGLPPGPISNPSIESIEAAMFPESSPYWFYLTTLNSGEVIYSASNEEHNTNKRKHL